MPTICMKLLLLRTIMIIIMIEAGTANLGVNICGLLHSLAIAQHKSRANDSKHNRQHERTCDDDDDIMMMMMMMMMMI